MRTRTPALVALLISIPVVSCSTNGGDQDDVTIDSGADAPAAAGAAIAPAAPATAELSLPLDAYSLSRDESSVVGQATEALVTTCFEGYGFAARDARPLPLFGAQAATDPHSRRYFVADAAVAAAHGYHAPPAHDVRREFYESHTAAELHVLGGQDLSGGSATTYAGQKVPAGGCLGQAAAAIERHDRKAAVAGEQLVSAIQAEAWHRALVDPRMVDGFAAWASCMATAGYPYADPIQANDDARWHGADVTPVEIATARADVGCKQEVGLVGLWSSVETEMQHDVIAEHRGKLDAYRGVLDAQVDRAESVLATTQP